MVSLVWILPDPANDRGPDPADTQATNRGLQRREAGEILGGEREAIVVVLGFDPKSGTDL